MEGLNEKIRDIINNNAMGTWEVYGKTKLDELDLGDTAKAIKRWS